MMCFVPLVLVGSHVWQSFFFLLSCSLFRHRKNRVMDSANSSCVAKCDVWIRKEGQPKGSEIRIQVDESAVVSDVLLEAMKFLELGSCKASDLRVQLNGVLQSNREDIKNYTKDDTFVIVGHVSAPPPAPVGAARGRQAVPQQARTRQPAAAPPPAEPPRGRDVAVRVAHQRSGQPPTATAAAPAKTNVNPLAPKPAAPTAALKRDVEAHPLARTTPTKSAAVGFKQLPATVSPAPMRRAEKSAATPDNTRSTSVPRRPIVPPPVTVASSAGPRRSLSAPRAPSPVRGAVVPSHQTRPPLGTSPAIAERPVMRGTDDKIRSIVSRLATAPEAPAVGANGRVRGVACKQFKADWSSPTTCASCHQHKRQHAGPPHPDHSSGKHLERLRVVAANGTKHVDPTADAPPTADTSLVSDISSGEKRRSGNDSVEEGL